MNFIYCFQSEWLKRKGSLASWLVVIGACFTPAIILVAKIVRHGSLLSLSRSKDFWENLWKSSWESMAIFLLPLGMILAASLITQIEYKNNTWKQIHTVPQRLTTLFFAKLAVILVMLLQFMILFNMGIFFSGVIPGLLFGVPYPREAIPYGYFLKEDGIYLLTCLPIVALQYMISLQFKNFLVPVGGGLALWILSVAVLNWKFGYLVPYTYCSLNYLKFQLKLSPAIPVVWMAAGYFIIFTFTGYMLYLHKKEKG
jgi:lantibiotic transport system permease protein